MATKNTAKRSAAMSTLNKNGYIPQLDTPSEGLYDTLDSLGFWWDAANGQWKKGNPPSTSIFKDDEGNATGLLRVRVMGMTEDAESFLQGSKMAGWSLIETSDPYPNRKGPGYRWYLTYKKEGV